MELSVSKRSSYKKGYASLLALAFFCGCTTTHTQEEPSSGGATYPTNASRARYACDGGQSIEVRFFIREGRAVLVREEKRMELQQQRTGSGFLYANGPTSIRGQGNELILQDGRSLPLRCKTRANE
jgi:membrane-bound inhibitor of C-type lysozyme